MCIGDQAWIGKSLFVAKGKLVSTVTNWYHPPPVQHLNNTSGKPYYLRRLFLWMPRKMWGVNFMCPNCANRALRSKGLYHRVRLVLDMKDFYYLAAEYMDCNECKGKLNGKNQRLYLVIPLLDWTISSST